MAKKKENPVSEETLKALRALEKKYELGIATPKDLDVVDTGSFTLNDATGINGYPLGKIVEIFGPESSGKSTICLHAIAEFQKAFPDRYVALFDYENSYDRAYATALGVDGDRLLIYQPDNQEQGYDMIIGIAEKALCPLIILDSHTTAIPYKIIEGEMTDATMGLQARNNSKFLGKVRKLLTTSNTCLIAVSQTRANIGGMVSGDISTGGNAWKFYADIRFKIWKALKKEDELNRTTVDVIKNKCAVPFGKAEFDIVWGEGIDRYGEIVDMAVDRGVIQKAGSWYSYNGDKLGQGRSAVTTLFRDNDELFNIIKNKTLLAIAMEGQVIEEPKDE